MLPQIDKNDIFLPGPQFHLLESNEPGANVETDDTGKRIIELLPASYGELIDSLKTGDTYISPKLIRYYLLVFWKAGILAKQGDSSVETEKEAPLRKSETESKISVIIVTFYGEKFIRKNLESIYNQTLLPGEVIVVDNVSGDKTLDIVSQEFKDVKIIRNKTNYHYARAVNIGVEAASGELVIILNQDIALKEDFIENLYRRYIEEEDKESTAAVIPQMRFSKLPTFINGIGNFITEKNWGSDNYFCAVDIGQFDRLRVVSSACFGAIMVTKEGWRNIGPLDNTYKSFYEDVDWSMRAHLKGMKLLAAPNAIVFHAFGGSYPSGLKLKLVAKNRMRFVLKHLKGKVLTKFLKKYIKMDIKNGLSYIRNKTYKNLYYYMMAYLRLLKELPGILLHRRKNKSDEETIGAFFTKGAPYVALGNKDLCPVINKHTIRGYYYFTEIDDFIYPVEPIT